MDSIWVSEAYDLGSIPSKATVKLKKMKHKFKLLSILLVIVFFAAIVTVNSINNLNKINDTTISNFKIQQLNSPIYVTVFKFILSSSLLK